MNAVTKFRAGIPTRLPLWRLEMEHEQALRRFKRTEAEHRASERELERIRVEIELRRKENRW